MKTVGVKSKVLFLVLSIFFLSFIHSASDFERVINNTSNTVIKQKLISFQNGGIENTVELPDSFSIDSLIHLSKTYLNTPHKMGGTTHAGIDCSGLVYACYKNFGIELPHSSHEQARYGRIIADKDSLQVGDLVFFYNSYNSNNLITHTGFYLGENKFIHTSASAGVIITDMKLSDYWKTRYLFATRIEKTVLD